MLWVRLRRLVQFAMLVAFIVLTLGGLQFSGKWAFFASFSGLDPLLGLSAMVASKAFIGFWLLSGVTLVLTLVLGRAWCGWLCPLGTVIEYAPIRKVVKRPLPAALRLGKFGTLAVVLGAALIGSLGPMILDPITILTRPLQEVGRAMLGSDAIGRSVGATLGRGGIHGVAWLALVPLGLVLALNLVGRRFWCATLCPLGGLLGLTSLIPGVRRIVNADTCTSCGRCSKVCPTDAIRRRDGMSTDTRECIDCMKCIAECPENANRFAGALPRLVPPGYQPERRAAIAAVGATGFALASAIAPVALATPNSGEVLRPPATDEARLAKLCVRCGACYGACPSGLLRPSVSFLTEAGPWTPMLDQRPVHCTQRCNLCAVPCPTDAIHTFTPEERVAKNLDVPAEVDHKRCRAWAQNRQCMACAGACPVIGALGRIERPRNLPAIGRHANEPPVNVPVIDAGKCIGCNLCAGACVMKPAAIGSPLPYDPSVEGSSGMRTVIMPNGVPIEVPEEVYQRLPKTKGGRGMMNGSAGSSPPQP